MLDLNGRACRSWPAPGDVRDRPGLRPFKVRLRREVADGQHDVVAVRAAGIAHDEAVAAEQEGAAFGDRVAADHKHTRHRIGADRC